MLSLLGIALTVLCRAQDHPSSQPAAAVTAYSSPEVAIDIERSDLGVVAVGAHTVAGAPGIAEAARCKPIQFVDLPVVADRWLQLTLSVPRDQRADHAAWLKAISEAVGGKSNEQLLKESWHALASGFDALAGHGGRPRVLRYVVRITPDDCTYTERMRFKPWSARRQLVIPIAVHAPGLLGPASASLIQSLFEMAAHETTHVFDLYPYSVERLKWLQSSEPVIAHDPTSPTSLHAEIRAVSVEHCFRRLIMPRPDGFDYLAGLWLEHKAEFKLKLQQEPSLRIWEQVFEREQSLVGPNISSNHDEDTIRLLSQCAIYMRHRQAVDAYPPPGDSDHAVAMNVFKRIRSSWAPVHFKDYSYSR
jgi:hypothetical protein